MELLAISMDGAEDAVQMADLVGAEFPILADPEGRVVREYGIYDLLGDGVAAPATLILGREGTIQWRSVGTNIGDRPSAEEILRRLQELLRPGL